MSNNKKVSLLLSPRMRHTVAALLLLHMIIALPLGIGSAHASAAKPDSATLIDEAMITPENTSYKTVAPVYADIGRDLKGAATAEYPIGQGLYFTAANARVKKSHVINGEYIAKDSPLYEITVDGGETELEVETISLDAEVRAYNTEKSRLQKEISTLESSYYKARSAAANTYDADLKLQAGNAKIMLDRAKIQLDKYVYEKERALNERRRAIEKKREIITDTVLTAPFDGAIAWINTDKKPGSRVDAYEWLMYAVSGEKLMFTCDNETGIYFRYGRTLTLNIDGIGIFDAKIVQTPNIMPQGFEDVKTLIAVYDLPQLDKELRAKITLSSMRSSAKNVLALPNNAVRNEDGKRYVFILEDNVVKKRYIAVGLSDSDYTQILDGITVEQNVILD